MGRTRTLKENKGLPTRWRYRSGSYYYQVPKGMEYLWDDKKEFKLGRSIGEAYSTWGERFIDDKVNSKYVSELIDKYLLEVATEKGISTQSLYASYANFLKRFFGKMLIISVKPMHVYQYIEARKKKKINDFGKKIGGVSIARREVTMFSECYSYAVRWGLISRHPFKGQIKFDREEPRKRYVEDWELQEFLSLQPTGHRLDNTLVVQAYTRLKLMTGLRQQDLLMMTVDQLKEDGIHVTPKKTKQSSGQSLIIEWNSDLRSAVDIALDLRPVDIAPHIFCNRYGLSYYDEARVDKASGWKSLWKRYMNRALKETNLEKSFREHDLRAKTASDLGDCEAASKLLGHSSVSTTRKHYMRKAEVVTPHRSKI